MAHVENVSKAQEATVTITMTVGEAQKVNYWLLNAGGNARAETDSIRRAIGDGIRRAEGR